MFSSKNLFFVLTVLLFFAKGQGFPKNRLNISMGINNTQTVIFCESSMHIYESFDLTEILTCPCVMIEKKNLQLVNMKITIEDERKLNITFSPPLISIARPMIKLSNNSFIDASNFTRSNTSYISFSSELICRYSFFHNATVCFYYSSSINFIEIEHHFDQITSVSLRLPFQTRKRLWLILTVVGLLILIICLAALYILCSNRLLCDRMIHLDYIVDSQSARDATLKLAPEPVLTAMFFIIFILFISTDFPTNALQCLSSSDKSIGSKGSSCQFSFDTIRSIPTDSELTALSGCKMATSGMSLIDGITAVHSCYGEVLIDYQTKAMTVFFTHVSPPETVTNPYDDMLSMFHDLESVVQYKIDGNLKNSTVQMTTRIQCKTADNCALGKLRQLLANLTIIEARRDIFKQLSNFLIPHTSAAASELTCEGATLTGDDGVCGNKDQFCRYERSKLTFDTAGCFDRDPDASFDLKYRFNVIEQMKEGAPSDPERGLKCFYLCKTNLCNSKQNAHIVGGMLHGFAFASGARANIPNTHNQVPSPHGGQRPGSAGVSLHSSFFYQSMMICFFLFIQLFSN